MRAIQLWKDEKQETKLTRAMNANFAKAKIIISRGDAENILGMKIQLPLFGRGQFVDSSIVEVKDHQWFN